MPLQYHPDPGTIVICDFDTGFRPPEMVKKRPVVIVSPRRRGSGIVTVVPLSSTAPVPVQPWHWPVPEGVYPLARGAMWGKADMLQSVGLARLDRVMMRSPDGKRRYVAFSLTPADLAALQRAITAALGLRGLS